MVAELPDVVISTGTEDLQGVDSDIRSLAKKFIVPIDRIRSISRPQLSESNNDSFTNLEIDTIRPQESRAHAFLRYLGLPVVADANNFYSPGFNPDVKTNDDKRKRVDDKIGTSAFKKLMSEKERLPQKYRKIFERQDINSSILALALRNVRIFNILGDTKDPFSVFDQKFTISTREGLVADFKKNNPLLEDKIDEAATFFSSQAPVIGRKFSGGQHILKPFIVDPRIVNTVMPKKNIICAPFLKDKTATKINGTEFLQRPGIELIIRERLKISVPDKQYLQNFKKVMSGEKSPNEDSSSVDTQTLLLTIFALADQNDLKDPNNAKILESLTRNEFLATFNLIRTIKAVIDRLNKAIATIDKARTEINWIPIPSIEGPEQGPRDAVLNRSLFTAQTEIDKRILELKIRKINAEARRAEDTDLGNFASPFEATTENSNLSQINKDLKKEIGRRNRCANDAFIAMGEIEIISGETTGLGLIDILSIYVALWAMDITDLLGLIDNDAFQRLKDNNPELANDSRIEGRNSNVSDCLKEFEKKLINVLSFVDKELARQRGNPVDEDGGLAV